MPKGVRLLSCDSFLTERQIWHHICHFMEIILYFCVT